MQQVSGQRWMILITLLASGIAGCGTSEKLVTPMVNLRLGDLSKEDRAAVAASQARTPEAITRLMDQKVAARWPARVGVARVTASSYCPAMAIPTAEAEHWEALAGEHHGMIRSVVEIPSMLIEDSQPELTDFRAAAARMRCDLLLLYGQADSWVTNYNRAAGLYWTVVGIWLVPGNTLEHETALQAILVDTRTGAILASAGGRARDRMVCPLGYVNIARDRLWKEVPGKAFEKLAGDVNVVFDHFEEAARDGVSQELPE